MYQQLKEHYHGEWIDVCRNELNACSQTANNNIAKSYLKYCTLPHNTLHARLVVTIEVTIPAPLTPSCLSGIKDETFKIVNYSDKICQNS